MFNKKVSSYLFYFLFIFLSYPFHSFAQEKKESFIINNSFLFKASNQVVGVQDLYLYWHAFKVLKCFNPDSILIHYFSTLEKKSLEQMQQSLMSTHLIASKQHDVFLRKWIQVFQAINYVKTQGKSFHTFRFKHESKRWPHCQNSISIADHYIYNKPHFLERSSSELLELELFLIVRSTVNHQLLPIVLNVDQDQINLNALKTKTSDYKQFEQSYINLLETMSRQVEFSLLGE